MLPVEGAASSEASIIVRVCSPDDAQRLGCEYASSWEGQTAGRWDFLTAWSGPRLVGSACLRWEGPFNEEVAAASPRQVELGFLHVQPEFRGRGVGTALVGLAEQRCRERGVTSLGLGVGDGNPRAAALYQRLGYAATGFRFTDRYTWTNSDGELQDAVEPGFYLTRHLNSAEARIGGGDGWDRMGA